MTTLLSYNYSLSLHDALPILKSIAGASRELELLVQLMPANAHIFHDDHIIDVKIESLKENDVILIKPGEKIAADGIIRSEEHTSELQSLRHLVCRLLLEKKKK